MSFDSLIKSRIIAHITGEPRLLRKRAAFERRRTRESAAHVVDYFHDVSDPYSHLTAQVLRRFQDRYDIELRPHLISAPPDWAAPDRTALECYSQRDAARLATKAGLAFPETPAQPTAERLDKARAIVAAAHTRPDFPETVGKVGTALWQDEAFPDTLEINPQQAMAAADARLAKLGHYLGATFYYGGEWYWGVDRLHYLENRLRALGAARPEIPADPIFAPPVPAASPTVSSTIEAFVSFRSPYSYLVLSSLRPRPRPRPRTEC